MTRRHNRGSGSVPAETDLDVSLRCRGSMSPAVHADIPLNAGFAAFAAEQIHHMVEASSLTSLCTLESKYLEQWNDTANPALLRILAVTELQLVRYLIGEQHKRSASEEAQRVTRSASDEQ